MPTIENELAVSVETQRLASLYGLSAVLVTMDNIPNKKGIKKNIKKLRKIVIKDLGSEGGEELLMQNRGAVEMVVRGIKRDPSHSKAQVKKLLQAVSTEWYGSYTRGVARWQQKGNITG